MSFEILERTGRGADPWRPNRTLGTFPTRVAAMRAWLAAMREVPQGTGSDEWIVRVFRPFSANMRLVRVARVPREGARA